MKNLNILGAGLIIAAGTQLTAQEVISKDTTPEGVVITYTKGNINEALNDKNTFFLDSLQTQEELLSSLTQEIQDSELLNIYLSILLKNPDFETYTACEQNQILIDFCKNYLSNKKE